MLLKETPYSSEAAHICAVASAWVYASKEHFADALRRRFDQIAPGTCESVQVQNQALLVDSTAYFIRDNTRKMGILVFRGTQPFKLLDYLTDANAQPSPGQSKGFETVHGGFYRNTMEVWDDICEVLEHAHETGMETLFITGHSLGGAMAVIAGALVLENPVLAETLLGIYTFGQPAVGGADFAMHANDIGMHMLYRHVYKRDIIPLFPPRILGDFFHFGAEISYKKDRWEPEPWATAPLLIGVFELLIGAAAWVGKQMVITEWIANRLPYSIADHLPENYLRGWSK